MTVWRDVWDGMPTVLIVAEEDAQDGVIRDPVLFLFDVSGSPVTVTSDQGEQAQVHLPDHVLRQTGIAAHLDLSLTPVEPPK